MMKKKTLGLFISLILIGIVLGIFIKPSIQLSGIENGKVYATHPVIDMKDSFGSAHVTLNGKKITPNYTVKENGRYTLIGESSLLWKKKKVTYQFVVDDKPPAVPRIKETVKKVYFKEAQFTLEKENQVTYTSSLNGKEISLDQPIQQLGKNTLTITATKPNGLTSKKEITFSIDNKTYSKNTVNQFLDYYFANDIPALLKFTDNVGIKLVGDYNEEDKKMIETAIKQIKTFFPYDMKIVDTYSKDYSRYIKMVFTPTNTFNTYDVDLKEVWGVERAVRFDQVLGPLESLVLIGTDKVITRDYRNSVILHELLHAVGLSNHLPSPQSSLYTYANKSVVLDEKEQMYGELLYLGDLDPNISKEETMEELEKRIQ